MARTNMYGPFPIICKSSGVVLYLARAQFIAIVSLTSFLALLFLLAHGWPTEGMAVSSYFPDVNDNLTKITWDHGVNSQEKLKAALKNKKIMMLEADILMGKKEGSDDLIPIMAHPPDTTSDLSFEDFLQKVIDATLGGKKKGIKLDFKEIDAVKPVLQQLKDKKKQIKFPIFINADIAKGPVNATTTPLDAKEFLNLTKTLTPKAIVSVGWTTRFGNDDKGPKPITDGQYTKENVDEMLKFLEEAEIETSKTEVTFPIRAGIAVRSINQIMRLIASGTKASVTIWSPLDDPVNKTELLGMIDQITVSRCYVDVPFSLVPESENPNQDVQPVPSVDTDEVEPKDNPTTNESSRASISMFLMFLAILSLAVFVHQGV